MTKYLRLQFRSKFQAYLSANKPIMGVIDGEVKDMILKYGIGKVAEPNNIDSIAAVFEEFIKESKDGDKSFGNKAKELNDGLFNREKNISKITSILEKTYQHNRLLLSQLMRTKYIRNPDKR